MTIQELKVLITAETQGLQKALKQVQHQMSTMTKKVTNGVKSATSTINKSIHSLEHSFKALGSVLSKALSTTALLLFGRAASRVASDLEEVQNVVDVAFGDMADEVEYFAKRCASAFGLSELQAKKASSTFMAMGKSMGISGLAAKTMALQLAALSGDMASFYNVSQDLADIALKSVFTGETETLKQYGIVMTEANLETYRLAKGLKIKYRDMSQAAKVALRYNYVMEQTALAQGDFARTSGSWANQLRLLRMQWEELMQAMGVVLNHVLLPIIQALNTILSLLVSIAKGWASMFSPNKEMKEVEKNKGGFAGTSDAINDATKAAKKYRATLAGFDELERLNPEKESSGAGSGAGANIDFDIIEPYDFSAIGGSFEEVQGKLRDLINAFNNGVRELDNKLYNMQTSFKNAGKALGDIVNQIIYGINFGNIGKLIGDGINSIINFMNNLLSTIDWYGLGLKLSIGVNSAFERIDWEAIGQNIALKINALWETLKGFIDALNWQLIGNKISQMITTAFEAINWDAIISTISKAINGIFQTLQQIIDTVDLKTMLAELFSHIVSLVEAIDWYAIGSTVHDGIAAVLDAITFTSSGESLVSSLVSAITDALKGLNWVDLLAKAFDALKTAIRSFWTEVFNGNEVLASGATTLTIVGAALAKLIGPLTKLAEVFTYFKVSKLIPSMIRGFSKMTTPIVFLIKKLSGFDKVLENMGITMKNTLLTSKGIMGMTENGLATIHWENIFTGMKSHLADINSRWSDNLKELISNTQKGVQNGLSTVKTTFTNGLTALQHPVDSILIPLKNKMAGMWSGISTGFTTAMSTLQQGLVSFGSNIANVVLHPITAIKSGIGVLMTSLKSLFAVIAANPFTVFVIAITAIIAALIHAYKTSDEFRARVDALYNDTIKPIVEKIKELVSDLWENHLKPLADKLFGGESSVFKQLMTILGKVLDVIANVVMTAAETLLPALSSAFVALLDLVQPVLGNLIDAIGGIITAAQGVIEFIAGVFTGDWSKAWEGIKKIFKGVFDALINIAKGPINIVIGLINGLCSGVVKAFNSIKRIINSLHLRIPDWVPLFGGKSIGFNLQMSTYTPIPKLAHGGVAYESTLAEIGEYKGARSNPEIVAPQSLIKETIDDSNAGLISAMYQMCHMVVDAIDNKDMDVRIGDDTIAMAASRGNQNYIKRTGKPLLGY